MIRMLLLIGVILVTGCDQRSNSKDISDLKNELNQLAANHNQLKYEVSRLQSARVDQILEDPAFKVINISASDTGYSFIESGPYVFPIMSKNYRKYAGGYKITLMVGNPYFTRFTRPTFTIKYGPKQAKDQDYEVWDKSLQTLELNPAVVIHPGSWTPVTLTIAPATDEDIATVRVAMKLDQISLSTRAETDE